MRGRAFTAPICLWRNTIIVDETLVRRPLATEIRSAPRSSWTDGTIIRRCTIGETQRTERGSASLGYHDYGHTAWVGALTAVVRSTLPPAIASKRPRGGRGTGSVAPTANARALTERIAESYGSRQFATRC